jgi:hypothetical protein
MGYGAMDVKEFGEYNVTCFDKGANSGGLYAKYVNMFLKLKQESSGYPSWVHSKEDKVRYIEEYRRIGNSSRQGVYFKKCEATKFGKGEIKHNVG